MSGFVLSVSLLPLSLLACGSVSTTDPIDAGNSDDASNTPDATVEIDAAVPLQGALHLDGDDDIVVIPPSALFNSTDFTVEFWIKPDVDHSGTVVTRRNGPETLDYLWEASVLGGDGLGWNMLYQEGSQAAGFIPGRTSGQWQHLVFQFSAAGHIFYIDGVGRNSSAAGTPLIGDNFGLHIGQTMGSVRGFDGMIDELRFWDRRLSPEEISAGINVEIDPSEAVGLVGYWRFNEPLDSQVVIDSSGNNLDGTLGLSNDDEEADPSRVASDAPITPL